LFVCLKTEPECTVAYPGPNGGKIELSFESIELQEVKFTHQSTMTNKKYYKDGFQLSGYYYPNSPPLKDGWVKNSGSCLM
jgi:hypothetical protein